MYQLTWEGCKPYTLQYIVGFSVLDTSSYAPFYIDCFLIDKYKFGSWADLNLYKPFPHDWTIHCWLYPPLGGNWMISAPLFLLAPQISRTISFMTLIIANPFYCLTKVHLWFHLLLLSHWTIFSIGFLLAFGTSMTFPVWLFTMIELFPNILFLSPPTC